MKPIDEVTAQIEGVLRGAKPRKGLSG